MWRWGVLVALLVGTAVVMHGSGSSYAPAAPPAADDTAETPQAASPSGASRRNMAPPPHEAPEKPPPPPTGTAVAASPGDASARCYPTAVVTSRTCFPQLAMNLFSRQPRRNADVGLIEGGGAATTKPFHFRFVEIGVDWCENTVQFNRILHHFYAGNTTFEGYVVDSWGHRGVELADDGNVVQDKNEDAGGAKAKRYCSRYFPQPGPQNRYNVTMVQGLSVASAARFPDNYFDFIYIDALHTYNATKDDMDAWWPKLRPGGLFAGDDFGDRVFSHLEKVYKDWYWIWRDYGWGTVRASVEFAKKQRVPLHVAPFETHYLPGGNFIRRHSSPRIEMAKPMMNTPNWYIFKPPVVFRPCFETVLEPTDCITGTMPLPDDDTGRASGPFE